MLFSPTVLAVRTFKLGRCSAAIRSGAGAEGLDHLRHVWFDRLGPVGPALTCVCVCVCDHGSGAHVCKHVRDGRMICPRR